MNKKILILLSTSIVCLLGWMIFQSRIAKQQPPTHIIPDQIIAEEVEDFSGAGKSLDAWSFARSYPLEKIKVNKFTESYEIKV